MSDIKAEVRQVPCNQIVWQLCNVSLQAGQAFSNAVDASQTCDKRCVLHVSKDPLGRQQHLHTDVHALPDSCCWGERLRSLFRSTAVRARPGTCLSPVSSIHVIWRRCASAEHCTLMCIQSISNNADCIQARHCKQHKSAALREHFTTAFSTASLVKGAERLHHSRGG